MSFIYMHSVAENKKNSSFNKHPITVVRHNANEKNGTIDPGAQFAIDARTLAPT